MNPLAALKAYRQVGKVQALGEQYMASGDPVTLTETVQAAATLAKSIGVTVTAPEVSAIVTSILVARRVATLTPEEQAALSTTLALVSRLIGEKPEV